jgi:hypothetical protein
MFQPYTIGQRQIPQPQAVSVAGKSIPAPTGGLNARDAIANMPETDAVICDNFLPTPSNVQLRNGRLTAATFAGNCETLAAYPGLLANMLFGAVNNAGVRSIFRVDGLAGGPVGAPVVGGAGGTIQPITSTQYDWVMSSTGAVEALYLVNGVDNPLLFDGTTWWSVTELAGAILGVGTFTSQDGAITGVGTLTGTGTNGTYPNTALTGGTGTGAIATITVSGGNVTAVVITTPGVGYGVGNVLSFVVTGGAGTGCTVSSVTAALTNGSYPNTALTGGTGAGAVGTITVAGGVVTGVTISSSGAGGYLVGDTLSFAVTGGAGTAKVTSVTAPYALGGVSPNTLSAVGSYHGSLFFIQANSFNVWWLAVDAISGALNQLPLGAYFSLGGSLVSILTVSIDNSEGLQDYIAFISSTGEVVVFQGYNPASTTTWFLSAHFRLGRPIGRGRRCWQKMGSDAAVICVDGVILMSQALLTDRSQSRGSVSDKIRNAINADILNYGNNFGWQAQLYPAGNKLLINVPSTQASTSYQYVMSTLNASWCTFGKYASPWNAYCFEVLGDALYYGTTGSVQQCDTGEDDAGASIQGLCTPAFSYFGMPGRLKRWTMARPIFTVNGSLAVGLTMNVDFAMAVPSGTVPATVGSSAPWNTSPWNTTLWGDATIISKEWIGISGLGYAGSLSLQVNAKDVSIQWQSTDYQFEPGGLM